MGNTDQPRNERGEWTSGDSAGRQPVQSHAGQASMHTNLRLSAAARDRIIRGKGTDQRHFPVKSDANVASTTDLIGTRVTPGKIDPRVNDATRKLVKSLGG